MVSASSNRTHRFSSDLVAALGEPRGSAPVFRNAPYSIVYADPPWRFEVRDRDTGLQKAPDQHYETLSVEEMSTMCPPVADDALLMMRVYDPMLPEAMWLADLWGFDFITPLFRWMKTTEHPGQLQLFPIEHETPPMGLGYHTRGGGCEECWLFKRGNGLPVLRHDIRKEFFAPVREHSRKPDEIPGWIVDLYGPAPRIEMFSRIGRPGWDYFGNEVLFKCI